MSLGGEDCPSSLGSGPPLARTFICNAPRIAGGVASAAYFADIQYNNGKPLAKFGPVDVYSIDQWVLFNGSFFADGPTENVVVRNEDGTFTITFPLTSFTGNSSDLNNPLYFNVLGLGGGRFCQATARLWTYVCSRELSSGSYYLDFLYSNGTRVLFGTNQLIRLAEQGEFGVLPSNAPPPAPPPPPPPPPPPSLSPPPACDPNLRKDCPQ